jgi:hypothetical protein
MWVDAWELAEQKQAARNKLIRKRLGIPEMTRKQKAISVLIKRLRHIKSAFIYDLKRDIKWVLEKDDPN